MSFGRAHSKKTANVPPYSSSMIFMTFASSCRLTSFWPGGPAAATGAIDDGQAP